MKSQRDIIVSHLDIAETYIKAKDYEKGLSHIEKAYQLAIVQRAQHINDEEPNAQLANVLKCYGEIVEMVSYLVHDA